MLDQFVIYQSTCTGQMQLSLTKGSKCTWNR